MGSLKKDYFFSFCQQGELFKVVLLELKHSGRSRGGLDEMQIMIRYVWRLTSESTGLTSTQVILILHDHRVQEPHLEWQESNHPYVMLFPQSKTQGNSLLPIE